MQDRFVRCLIAGAAAAALAGCAVGPDYARPTTPVAQAYKEPAPANADGWAPARPGRLAPSGEWWVVFNDPTLSALAARVAVSNQNVAAADAAYRQAQAIVREQRASLFPAIGLDVGATRSGSGRGTVVTSPGGGGTGVVTGGAGGASTSYRSNVNASWEADVWGGIRRSIEGAKGAAQASEADLAAATLSAQAELASSYFELRAADTQIALLTRVVDGYQRSLKIARNRYEAGVAPHSDLLQAQSQLATTQADLKDLVRSRAVFEHAIAVLVGETPEAFTLAADPNWAGAVPQIPAGVPSILLQRRPDIAAAERRAASASAGIGAETAAYFPSLVLTGSYGFATSELANLLGSSANVWSFGASAAQTLINGGATRARVAGARAAYDQSVAQYRQTVLAAFQDVEDQLAAQRSLAEQHELRRQAAADGDRAATMVLNQYREGQVAYTDVVAAQATALNAQRSAVQVAAARQTTAVALIAALGGGWTAPS
ncbi:efflux transporter outer membrane subunit [Phenylobacterium sp. LjRoot219]|uniref:efflux transporter outer membrane subunit n=1 Tax=Phenylobacterium sp. LjRoot219 TaxID=3342283 RepID=UPI003ED0FFD0